MVKEYLILSGTTVHSENGIKKNSALVIKDNLISKIISTDEIKNFPSAEIIHLSESFHVLPGFIDMHIHGANGKDVMDANFDALETISKTLAAEGTTSFLATTMTASKHEIEDALVHVRDYMQHQNEIHGATVLGVHLEGPFLSPNKVGAQRSDLILHPDISLVEHWQKISNNIIKLITLAPELPNSLDMIHYLKKNNILASIGHSDATFAETMTAINAGCSHVTHLFNAMRGVHQREPGAVTAALLSNDVTAEIIVDGIHLHPAIVELIFKLKKNCVLVTDAMRAKCLCDGTYDLGGQQVEVKNNTARLTDGTLAGSTLKMSDAIKLMMQFTSCNLSDIIRFTSENPAKSLGIFHERGSIKENKIADLVVLDEKFDVVMTICSGTLLSCQPRA